MDCDIRECDVCDQWHTGYIYVCVCGMIINKDLVALTHGFNQWNNA